MFITLIFAIIAIVAIISYFVKNSKKKDEGNRPTSKDDVITS
jgi:hypothetical protein